MFLRFLRFTAVLAIAAIMTAALSMAKDGRDFAGFYKIANVAESGGRIELTLTLQIYNYSDADLNQAVVAVHASNPGTEVLATFAPVELWRKGSDAILTQTISIPKDEYDRWTHDQPAITITYSDADRQEWQRTAQLSERAALPL